jgi:hypothetical protein
VPARARPCRDVALPLSAAPAASTSAPLRIPRPARHPRPHLPQDDPRPTTSWSPRATRLPVVCAACARRADRRSVRGPLPWARADRGSRRITAASLPSSSFHRRARALFKAVHPPRVCATPPPLLPLHRAHHGRRLKQAPFPSLSSLANIPTTFPTSHVSPSTRLWESPCAPLAEAVATAAAAAACLHHAPALVALRPNSEHKSA